MDKTSSSEGSFSSVENKRSKQFSYIVKSFFIFALLIIAVAVGTFFAKNQKYLGIKPTPTPAPTALKVNNTDVSVDQFNAAYNHNFLSLNDKKQSFDLSVNQFIANTLLKEEYKKMGNEIKTDDLQKYIKDNNLPSNFITDANKLEIENNFLKEKIFSKNISWYTGFYISIPFDLSPPEATETERKTRARKKIEEIRNALLQGGSYNDLADKYNNDSEVVALTAGQGYGGTFEKMSLTMPIVNVPEFPAEIKKLKAGDVSQIITFSSAGENGKELSPYAFAVIKITDSNQGTFSSYEEWLAQKKNQSKIMILIKQ